MLPWDNEMQFLVIWGCVDPHTSSRDVDPHTGSRDVDPQTFQRWRLLCNIFDPTLLNPFCWPIQDNPHPTRVCWLPAETWPALDTSPSFVPMTVMLPTPFSHVPTAATAPSPFSRACTSAPRAAICLTPASCIAPATSAKVCVGNHHPFMAKQDRWLPNPRASSACNMYLQ